LGRKPGPLRPSLCKEKERKCVRGSAERLGPTARRCAGNPASEEFATATPPKASLGPESPSRSVSAPPTAAAVDSAAERRARPHSALAGELKGAGSSGDVSLGPLAPNTAKRLREKARGGAPSVPSRPSHDVSGARRAKLSPLRHLRKLLRAPRVPPGRSQPLQSQPPSIPQRNDVCGLTAPSLVSAQARARAGT